MHTSKAFSAVVSSAVGNKSKANLGCRPTFPPIIMRYFFSEAFIEPAGHTLAQSPQCTHFSLSIVTCPFLTVIASSRQASTHFMHSIHLQSRSTETGSTAWTPKSLICGMEQLFGHPDTANFSVWCGRICPSILPTNFSVKYNSSNLFRSLSDRMPESVMRNGQLTSAPLQDFT